MEKQFILVRGIKIHYRKLGVGETIVLLHASPRSGKMLETFGKMLSEYFEVIIPDLPGYGLSEPIPEKVETLYEVVPYLRDFFNKLNLVKPLIYGTATGAQLGIAFAITHPNQVRNLYLDNPAHFLEEEYQQISKKYFVDLTPDINGSHLQNLWNHVRESMMYFPWYDHSPENQFSTMEPSPFLINELVKEYLDAGVRYDELYRAAFFHERVEKVQQLRVPTVIFKWEASILLNYIQRLISFQLPENVKVVKTEKDSTLRYEKMVEVIINSAKI